MYGSFTYSYSRSAQRGTPYFSSVRTFRVKRASRATIRSPRLGTAEPVVSGSGITQLTDGTQSYTRNQTSSVGGNLIGTTARTTSPSAAISGGSSSTIFRSRTPAAASALPARPRKRSPAAYR